MAQHRWAMSWPGNFCVKCGAEDHIENAIALNWYDPYDEKWDTEEHRLICEMCDNNCLIENEEDRYIY